MFSLYARVAWACALLFIGQWSATAGPTTSITLDSSFGHSPGAIAPVAPHFYQITPAMGVSYGPNLFQSFGTFNLGTGDTAAFTVNSGTANVIARITGGSPSSIDGTLISPVNLFLINPAGIMFGANAQLNVAGSFVASSADYAKLGDGGMFYADANHPIADQGLTAAPVAAFGFLSSAPKPISFTGTQFTVAPGTSLQVIGGDVTTDLGTTLAAPSAALTIFSAASAGEVPFSLALPGAGFAFATNPTFGAIMVKNGSNLNINGFGGGAVVIRAGHLTIDGSSVASGNAGPFPGGPVLVQSEELTLQNGGRLDSATVGTGNAGNVSVTNGDAVSLISGGLIGSFTESSGTAGDVSVQTKSLNIDGTATPTLPTGITSNSDATATGNGGKVNVIATGAISLAGAGKITSFTYSSGTSGDVTVKAGSLTLNGTANPNDYTAIGSVTGNLIGFVFNNTGNAGSLNVDVAGALVIEANGEITSGSFSLGNGGDLTVHAGSLRIDGSALPSVFTGISSDSGTYQVQAFTNVPFGNAGSVTVNVDGELVLVGSGSISTDTFTMGNAGNVFVHAGSILIDGRGVQNALHGFTVISSATGTPFQTAPETGNAGSVTVLVDGSLTILGNGEIAADSFSRGNGGDLSVHAGSILIDGLDATPGLFTGISSGSDSIDPTSPGNGGSVEVTSDSTLTITNRGGISGTTTTTGRGGDLSVLAGSLDIVGDNTISADSTTPGSTTGIQAQAQAAGNSGKITVGAGTLEIADGGVIDTSSNFSDAGDIEISSANLTLRQRGIINTSAGVNGGKISLHIGGTLYLLNSQITATAVANGGSILIDPQFVVLDNSPISANAAMGQGGNITIITNNFLNTESLITATGTTNGTVDISAPDLDLSGSLAPLSGALVSGEDRLRESCARAANHEFSSFVVVGRGGMESAPEELQPDFGMDPGPTLSRVGREALP